MSAIDFTDLKNRIKGELFTDDLHKIIYATDASVYREFPLGVVFPMDHDDVVHIVKFCKEHRVAIIPRSGGTSLAGQCVGVGLVVDVSRHMNTILHVDPERKTVTVQPGVIRDELNHHLKEYGLMFGPNTSTANRATIGGMVGNNSCGSTSIVFGTTRDHVKSLKTVLSDGSVATFGNDDSSLPISPKNELQETILTYLKGIVNNPTLQEEIVKEFPKKSIRRRNTGYAIDTLVEDDLKLDNQPYINVCNLLAGSEGTLAFTTEITVGLVDVPAPFEVLVPIHYSSIDESMRSVPTIMKHQPFACELMDKTILDCTKGQIMYEPDRFFLEGDPLAVMLVSFVANTMEDAEKLVVKLVDDLRESEFGYHYPIIKTGVKRIWNLRKAGLGLLANLPGDMKAVTCIEDTAVAIEDLAEYIAAFTTIMEKFGQKSVYYAHAGDGEIHLRPILDLKKNDDKQLFYEISNESAKLVKKYSGSLSGEHGDGRLRAPFIKDMIGEMIYSEFIKLKEVWDPHRLFNPGKIVDAPPMNEYLRYDNNHVEREYETVFDFSATDGILRAAEKCTGSGDCRKSTLAGGTMCPSFMATRNEKDSTRARANTLREVLTRPNGENPWKNEELKEVLDLCLSCKGCTSECPSNVDMSTMKAEFSHQYQKENGVPLRSKIFANFNALSKIGAAFGGLSNFALSNPITGTLAKKAMGIHSKRSFPRIHKITLKKRLSKLSTIENPLKTVYLFCDEFTNYNDPEIGEIGVKLLQALGYEIKVVDHAESGRAALSKGVLDLAVKYANQNVSTFSPLISASSPLIGIEPSAILSFRDEYPKLVTDDMKEDAKELSRHVYTIEEFIYQEVKNGTINSSAFDETERNILVHGHCHQKALTDIKEVAWILGLPKNNRVELISSGCCGMAGSFGYEKEHYKLSMEVGELILFPTVREKKEGTIIAASGTSCRHQILDGTAEVALHPVQILWNSIKK